MAAVSKAGRSGLTGGVMKALSIFTGVQAVTMLCSVIRTKVIALWLGPAAMGIMMLYTQAIETFRIFFQMGVRNSAVRDIAVCRDNIGRLQRVAYVVRRWSWALGLFGVVAMALLSPWLSEITFGDRDHTWGFIIVSVTLFLSAAYDSEQVILQGTGRLRRLARVSVAGALSGLAVSIPMYKLWGIDGIVPSILAYSLTAAIAALIFHVKAGRPKPAPTPRQTFDEGLGFIRLGFFMTLSAVITTLAGYIFAAWLNHRGGEAEVGYFQAGYTVVTRYLGMVFIALSMEFYPRITRSIASARRTSLFVSHEISLLLMVLTPVAITMIAADDLVINILYDREFYVVAPYLSWALGATALRVVSVCLGFVVLAHGDGKIYLMCETTSAIAYLGLSVAGYELWGLTGLGVAYIGWYAIYLLVVGLVFFKRYGLRLHRNAVMAAAFSIVLSLMCAAARVLEMRIAVIMAAVAVSALSLRAILPLMRKS